VRGWQTSDMAVHTKATQIRAYVVTVSLAGHTTQQTNDANWYPAC